jgi:Na+/H+-dicarboxylate symporter
VSLTTRVLIGLAAGLVAGLLLSVGAPATSDRVIAVVAPLGTLFINAIRMTVIPLVVASLIVGVTSAPDARAVGRVGWRALLVFLALLTVISAVSIVVARPLLELIALDPSAVASLRASASGSASQAAEGAKAVPGLGEWLVSLVPSNPIRAAADGAMLPLIVFALAFGLAITRLEPVRRAQLAGFFGGVADASLVLVRWILVTAPIGVFALTLPIVARLGIAAAGAMAWFIGIVVVLCVAAIVLLLYPVGIVGGRVAPRRFAQATLPGQAVAFTSRSSLASLPAMFEGARDVLRLPDGVTSFLLPLAAAVFRTGSAVFIPVSVLFVARLYDVDLTALQMATVVVMSVVTTFSVPSVPGGTIYVMVPVLLSVGLPIEGIGILFGVDTIPDMFRTATNVAGHMAAATVISRGVGSDVEAADVPYGAVEPSASGRVAM